MFDSESQTNNRILFGSVAAGKGQTYSHLNNIQILTSERIETLWKGACYLLIVSSLNFCVRTFRPAWLYLEVGPLCCVVLWSLSRVLLLLTPWTAAHQASLPFASSPEFAKTHLHWVSDAIQPSHPLLPPSPPALSLSHHQSLCWLFSSGGQSIGASASASVLPVNIQSWFHLGLTNLIFLVSRGPSRLLQNHSSRASILWLSALFMVQLRS